MIAATSTNIFFVHGDYKELIIDKDYQLDEIRDDTLCKNYVFTGYDGKIYTSKKLHLHWHNLCVDQIKYLPKVLQKNPLYFNFSEELLFYFYKFYKSPMKYFRRYGSPLSMYEKIKSIIKKKIYPND